MNTGDLKNAGSGCRAKRAQTEESPCWAAPTGTATTPGAKGTDATGTSDTGMGAAGTHATAKAATAANTPFELARAALVRLYRGKQRKRTRKPAARRQKTPEHVLSPTQQQGLAIEDLACQYLNDQGLEILARNLKTRLGEIDILARENDDLIFCEVRHRMSNRFGSAEATVTVAKQRRLVRTAHALLPGLSLRFFGGLTPACRFDVLGHDGAAFTWLRAAFDADTSEAHF